MPKASLKLAAAFAVLLTIASTASWAQGKSRSADPCSAGPPAERITACSRIIDGQKGANKKLRVQAFIGRGRAHLAAGQIDKAIDDLTKALELEPSSAEALNERGRAHFEKGHFDSSVRDRTKALEIDPQATELYVLRGQAHAGARRWSWAKADYDAAIARDGRNADALYHRGSALAEMKEIDAALADFDRTIELEPHQARALIGRVRLIGKSDSPRFDAARALSDIERAIQLDRRNPHAHHLRGYLLANKGDSDAALDELDEVTSLDPKYTEAYALKADIQRGKGDLQAALKNVDTAIGLDPELDQPYFIKANILFEMKDYDKAVHELTAAIQRNPRFVEAYLGRGVSYQQKGADERAIQDFSEVIRLAPRHAVAYHKRGSSHHKLRNFEAAIKDYSEALAIQPDFAQALFDRGIAHTWTGEWRAAVDDFTRVIAREPGSALAYRSRGSAYLEIKQHALALKDLDEAVRLDPDDSEGYRARARAHTATDRVDLAIIDLDAAIRLQPDVALDYNFRSYLMRLAGQLDKAIESADTAIGIDPKLGNAYSARGEAFRRKGALERAIADFTEALNLNPNSTPTFAYRGLALEAKGDIDRARSDYIAFLNAPRGRFLNYDEAMAIARERLAALGGGNPAGEFKGTAGVLAAAAQIVPPNAAVAGGPRIALVIGNGAYTKADPLRNPVADAKAVAAALRDLGFSVIEGIDLDGTGMRQKVSEFGSAIPGASVTLVFYAGHGIQAAGRNYMIPIDAKLERPSSLAVEAIELGAVLSDMEAEKRTNLVILDACRNNPFVQTVGRGRSVDSPAGLAVVSAGVGTLIAFATSPDSVASDGEGVNSPFTDALVRHLRTPGIEARILMSRVRADVVAVTKGRQVPWDHSSLLGEFYFSGGSGRTGSTPAAAKSQDQSKPVHFVGKDGTRWQAVEGPEKDALIESLRITRGLTLASSEVVMAKKPLSFLAGYELLNLTSFVSRKKREDFFLIGNGDLLQLDGTNRQMYFVSDKSASITEHNAADYLRFFFQYVAGPYGPMFFVDDPSDVIWLRRPEEKDAKIVEETVKPLQRLGGDENVVQLAGTFLFKDCFFHAKLDLTLSRRSAVPDQFPGLITIVDHNRAACGDKGEVTGFHAFGATGSR